VPGRSRLSYTFKEPATPDRDQGRAQPRGPDYVYRWRVGDFPLATTPVPMAARRGSKAKVRFTGPMVDGVAPVEVAVRATRRSRCLGRSKALPVCTLAGCAGGQRSR